MTAQGQPVSADRERVDDLLDDAARTLDKARQAREIGNYDRALALCREAVDTAEDARETARTDAPQRAAEAESRLDDATRLRAAVEAERDARQRVHDALDDAEKSLDSAAVIRQDNPEGALNHLDGVPGALDTARETVAEHDLNGLADRVNSLERRHDQLREQLDDARKRAPATISTTPRRSLSYDDIKRGEAIGQGGNADVFRGTVGSADGQTVTLAVKEPRMRGTLNVGVVERMMEEAETWQQLDDHDHIVGVVDYDSTPIPWIAMEYMDGGHLGERTDEMSFE